MLHQGGFSESSISGTFRRFAASLVFLFIFIFVVTLALSGYEAFVYLFCFHGKTILFLVNMEYAYYHLSAKSSFVIFLFKISLYLFPIAFVCFFFFGFTQKACRRYEPQIMRLVFAQSTQLQ